MSQPPAAPHGSPRSDPASPSAAPRGYPSLKLVLAATKNDGVEVRNFEAFGEPGAVVYLADCVELMRLIPAGSVDAIFADPPYRLSGGGVTVKSGRIAPV